MVNNSSQLTRELWGDQSRLGRVLLRLLPFLQGCKRLHICLVLYFWPSLQCSIHWSSLHGYTLQYINRVPFLCCHLYNIPFVCHLCKATNFDISVVFLLFFFFAVSTIFYFVSSLQGCELCHLCSVLLFSISTVSYFFHFYCVSFFSISTLFHIQPSLQDANFDIYATYSMLTTSTSFKVNDCQVAQPHIKC